MTKSYQRLITLYPKDVAGIYGREMSDGFASGLDAA
jgi:hypothetical protein